MDAERQAPDEPPVWVALRLVWLAALVYAVGSSTRPGTTGRHLTALVLTVTTGVGFAGWLLSREWRSDRLSAVSIVVLAATGGVMTAVVSRIGILVVGIAGMCASSLFELTPAAALTGAGVVAAAIGYAAHSPSASVIPNSASGAVAGLVVGLGRRQQHERSWRKAELALAHQRTEVEHERAEVLAERNRIAREVHDVLAHTLSALSVQMEALDALVADGADQSAVRDSVQRSRRLVVAGLEETREAVRALRDEPVAVSEQIAAVAAEAAAAFSVRGPVRELTAAHGLALLRVAQEALSNARKHAPGAVATVTLEFGPSLVRLVVANSAATGAPSALAHTGGGYGIRGMQERVELLGGTLSAGPDGAGWRVQADIPA